MRRWGGWRWLLADRVHPQVLVVDHVGRLTIRPEGETVDPPVLVDEPQIGTGPLAAGHVVEIVFLEGDLAAALLGDVGLEGCEPGLVEAVITERGLVDGAHDGDPGFLPVGVLRQLELRKRGDEAHPPLAHVGARVLVALGAGEAVRSGRREPVLGRGVAVAGRTPGEGGGENGRDEATIRDGLVKHVLLLALLRGAPTT